MDVHIESSWKAVLQDEFEKSYFAELKKFLVDEISSGKTIYPHPKNIFHAFEACPFHQVKVVILGQDPYHTPGAAHGLCFSVPEGAPLPPSLQNIYKELKSDLGISPSKNGNLEYWAEQGVFLLNSVLTVQKGLAASHAKKGWETFTDRVIQELSEKREGIVFLLWGNYAKKKGEHINRSKHLVLEAGHPSPLSVRHFLGCQHFSKANVYLGEMGSSEIVWGRKEC
ncbi:MAG: uracil-DNA glycosylase [Candidatus Peregrinibacteria bacterium]